MAIWGAKKSTSSFRYWTVCASKACHGTHNVESPKTPGAKFSAGRLTESCGSCHKEQAAHFPASAHGKALAEGVKGAPNCLSCHRSTVAFVVGTTDTLSVKRAQEQLCLSCHRDDPDVRARTSPTAGFIAAYDTSAHGAALLKGNAKVANCVSCHGSHDMKKGSDPTSAETYPLLYKVEFQFYTDNARVYYTTDGSTPAGSFGTPSGTTAVLTSAYVYTYP